MAEPPLHVVVRSLRRLAGTPPAAEAGDQELLKRFTDHHDPAALEALVRRHGPMVRDVCRRLLGQAADVDDACQAVLLVLVRQARSIRRQRSLAGWLYGVAYRVAQRARREAVRRRQRERRPPPAAVPDPGAEAAWRELCAALDAELYRLPEVLREPLVLCYLEGRTRDEAAKQLDCSLRTLDRRLGQGRERLRVRLGRRGVTLSAALLATALSQQAAAAVLSTELLAAVTKAEGLIAGSTATAAGETLARPAALAKAVLKGMAVARLQMAAALVQTIGLAAGTALLAHQAVAGRGQQAPPPSEQAPAAKAGAGQHPQGPAATRLDRYGDPLPDGTVARMGTLRFRCGEEVWSVAFSPDGKVVASGSRDGTLRLWDPATGKELKRCPREEDDEYSFDHAWVHAVAFSPDGKTVATGNSDTTIRLWDVATGRQLWRVRVPDAWAVECVAFSPDGKALASGDRVGHSVRLWAASTGEEIGRLGGHQKWIHAVAFSPDGRVVAAGGKDNAIRIWEVASGKQIHRLNAGEGRWVWSVAFSPDGKTLVSAGRDKDVQLWDVSTGRLVRQWPAAKHVIRGVAFSPDGHCLAVAGLDPGLAVWDAATGKALREYAGSHAYESANCVAFSPDGRTLVSGSSAGSIQLWDRETGREICPLAEPQGAPAQFVFSRDGRALVSVSSAGLVRRWEVATGREISRFASDAGTTVDPWVWVSSLVLCPDGKTLVAGKSDGAVGFWDLATGKQLRQVGGELAKALRESQDRVQLAVLAPDGQTLACASLQARLYLLDLVTDKLLYPHGPITDQMAQALAFSPDGKLLALYANAGDGPLIQLWEVTTGKELRRLPSPKQGVQSLAFSADGKLLASGGWLDRSVHLWEVATGRPLQQFDWQPTLHPPPRMQVSFDGALALAFSPDNRVLAVSYSDREIRLWELASGRERRRLKGHQGMAWTLAFSADGAVLASGDKATIVAWDVYGAGTAGRPGAAEPALAELEDWWADLARGDAARADRAMRSLPAVLRQTVSLLRARLRPSRAPEERIAQLIADLDSEQFEVRKNAVVGLEKLGGLARPALRRALAGEPPLEVRRQIEQLLQKERMTLPPGDGLREVRAAEVLERLGSTEARQLLQSLAKGAPEARLTREAKASLERLARQGTSSR
jgi:RNA polymerase sigma factor (sigma-70 family)